MSRIRHTKKTIDVIGGFSWQRWILICSGKEIKDATQAAFGVVRRNHSDEQSYAIALYSDESAMAARRLNPASVYKRFTAERKSE